MRRLIRLLFALAAALLLAAMLAGQRRDERPDVKLPSGKSQRDEILKEEHKKSLEDVAEIRQLAGELEEDLRKSDYNVVSLDAVKKTEEIEKRAKRIRSRLKRY